MFVQSFICNWKIQKGDLHINNLGKLLFYSEDKEQLTLCRIASSLEIDC